MSRGTPSGGIPSVVFRAGCSGPGAGSRVTCHADGTRLIVRQGQGTRVLRPRDAGPDDVVEPTIGRLVDDPGNLIDKTKATAPDLVDVDPRYDDAPAWVRAMFAAT